ncbi:hypothetical protein AMS68_000931 [Peltaster fructicola]|uniref:OPA3-like protein n=1 Tax=Peltaster fructicola TaxID=286661 RepID=A0A6H0XL09_9PEZI|nr:hypothetical protein AMS68_000931 [Peltaster fructicola]
MSLTFKLLSLAIRTAAKPIGNYIKRQAKEHDGFRRFAVARAQQVHWIDMRMRLGILHDPEAQDRMHERQRRKEEEEKRKAETPTVRSEEEQKKHDADAARDKAGTEKKSEKAKGPNIRPLSDAKAIELGANFFSEAFIFGVAAGLLIWDAWRSRKKESARRDDVKERISTLETEVDRLRLKYEPHLEPLVDREPKVERSSWYDPRSWWTRTEPANAVTDAVLVPQTTSAQPPVVKLLESTEQVEKPDSPKATSPTPQSAEKSPSINNNKKTP